VHAVLQCSVYRYLCIHKLRGRTASFHLFADAVSSKSLLWRQLTTGSCALMLCYHPAHTQRYPCNRKHKDHTWPHYVHLSADAVSSSSPLWLQLTALTGPPWPTKVVPAPACFANGSHRQRAFLSLAAVSSLQPSPVVRTRV
jgi:hypothetical protein